MLIKSHKDRKTGEVSHLVYVVGDCVGAIKPFRVHSSDAVPPTKFAAWRNGRLLGSFDSMGEAAQVIERESMVRP